MRYLFCLLLAAGGLLAACTPNNVALGPNEFDAETEGSPALEVEVAREGVFTVQEGQEQPLPLAEVAPLDQGQPVTVDETGRAIIHLDDTLSVELLQGASIQVAQRAAAEGGVIDLLQNEGVAIFDMSEQSDADQQLSLQLETATLTATGGRFVVVHEPSLTWILALAAGEGDVQLSAADQTVSIIGGQARWVASIGEPGPSIALGKGVEAWLNGARNNVEQPALSEILLPPSQLLADATALTTLPAPGELFELTGNVQGAVNFTLDPKGIFGRPNYTLADCNGDGVQDIAIQNGILTLDFRQLQARVQVVEMRVVNRDRPGNGLLEGFGPDKNSLAQQQLQAAGGELQSLALRADQPLHYVELVVTNACFVDVTLRPPGAAGDEPVEIQAVTTPDSAPQGDAVVNVLGSNSAERLPQNGQLQAPNVGSGPLTGLLQIDGAQTDWDSLAQQSGIDWTPFSTIIFDEACANRFPGSETLTDLDGRVQLAYDSQNLYVAFIVNDDGLVTYTGADERYFLGDSPQLLLDLDLNGDFDTTQLSSDDIQIDLLPNIDAPQVALWRLNTLTSTPLTEAQLVVSPTDTGYFVEAAIPWSALNTTPQPGDRLGVVASISDNDSPDTDAQECIISTSLQRDWRNPTTWGTVLLVPTTGN